MTKFTASTFSTNFMICGGARHNFLGTSVPVYHNNHDEIMVVEDTTPCPVRGLVVFIDETKERYLGFIFQNGTGAVGLIVADLSESFDREESFKAYMKAVASVESNGGGGFKTGISVTFSPETAKVLAALADKVTKATELLGGKKKASPKDPLVLVTKADSGEIKVEFDEVGALVWVKMVEESFDAFFAIHMALKNLGIFEGFKTKLQNLQRSFDKRRLEITKHK